MKISYNLIIVFFLVIVASHSFAQDTERERPKEWAGIIEGSRFIDRFLPIPTIGDLTSDVWGCQDVLPRYSANGIEDADWSYWGGNIRKLDDGTFHQVVCRWPENAEKGHMSWKDSEIVHVQSNKSLGPYQIVGETIGKGHNPEFFQLKDGRFVIYVIGAYYVSDSINGPWEKSKFEFDPRDRKVIEGFTNFSFIKREDGTVLAVCRGGGIWISETGVSKYMQVANESSYPKFDGRYEDPVIWKTNIQYHMIVNDWLGRIAYYLRSKDGFTWKLEPGEAYEPGIAIYEDGTNVDWYKYERPKVLQDEYGRAYQMNFAVIDSSKWEDLANDHHSSKNIGIPLAKGKLVTVLNKRKITSQTKKIELRIEAEEDFNPHTDINLESLRFGASEQVNFGKGSNVISTKKVNDDLIVTFDATGNGLKDENFAGKLLGKSNTGKLLFAYARLPEQAYVEAVLSARKPNVVMNSSDANLEFEVQNFGQIKSNATTLVVEIQDEEKILKLSTKVSSIKPLEKKIVQLKLAEPLRHIDNLKIKIYTKYNTQKLLLYE